MFKMKWHDPVEVDLSQGSQLVQGPVEALVFLLDAWPDRRGPRYVAARSFCRAAISGRKSAEEARQMFIEAAQEAQITAH